MAPQQPAPHSTSPGAPIARLADEGEDGVGGSGVGGGVLGESGLGDGILAKGKKLLGLGGQTEGIGQAEKDAFAKAEEVAPVRTVGAPISPSISPPSTRPATTTPSLLPSPPLTASSLDRRASPRGSPRIAPLAISASPSRRRMHRSSSPGLQSPASSQIFERNVQEPEAESSPAIPNHVKTEDMIPPALDASALAITDDHLSPEQVEIVTHSAHQPAAAAVKAESVYSPSLAPEDSVVSTDTTEATPNYGSLASEDVKRLSFISFADVIQAEHVESDRESFGPGDSIQFMSLNSTSTPTNRSPSPVRSSAASERDGRTRSPGSPGGYSHSQGHGHGHGHGHVQSVPLGEELPLQVETMRQVIRKSTVGSE